MAARLIGQKSRVVAYMPSLRAMVKHFRAFSSYDERRPLDEPITLEADTSILDSVKEWPDPRLGPFSPTDKRFPLPGLMGMNVRVKQSQGMGTLLPQEPDVLTAPSPQERYSEVLEEFIKGSQETAEDIEDYIMERPSALDNLECQAMDCPQLLKKEFASLFPDKPITDNTLTMITISQKTRNDMSGWNPDVEEEREELLEMFVNGAQEMCEVLHEAGYWADFIDPSSGKPFLGAHTNSTLFETDERYRHFGFEINDLGCCKVISHHLWGTHAYVGSLFTNAPADHPVITEMLQKKEWDES